MALSPGAIRTRSQLFKKIKERFPTEEARSKLFADKIWAYATDEELRQVLGLGKTPVANKAANKPAANETKVTSPDNKKMFPQARVRLENLKNRSKGWGYRTQGQSSLVMQCDQKFGK